MKVSIRNLWVVVAGTLFPWVSALAEGAAEVASGAGQWAAPGVGLGIAIAVFSAAAAQGKIAAAYMEGASRNPGAESVMKTPLILSLAFVESLVLFTVLIVILLLGKIA